jgi:hypothetical protein
VRARALGHKRQVDEGCRQLCRIGGQRSLKARLGNRPSTLFAAVGKLAPGAYSLAWRAKARDGEISAGTIPFRVAPRQVPANPPAGRLT